jgi:putative heme iron utilization protein
VVVPLREAAALVAAQRWLALATVDENGAPALSYIPFTVAGGVFAMVASRLAAHTANLQARRPASILFVGDDADDGDAYARARFTIGVSAAAAAPGTASAEIIWSSLEARHGPSVSVLRTLPDFSAFELEPIAGRLILGFAAAHDFDRVQLAEMMRAMTDRR